MSYRYCMARFDPEDRESRPIAVRVIEAESECDAYAMMGEPVDQTYWQVTDTNDPNVRL